MWLNFRPATTAPSLSACPHPVQVLGNAKPQLEQNFEWESPGASQLGQFTELLLGLNRSLTI
jgi:hypothetical protein